MENSQRRNKSIVYITVTYSRCCELYRVRVRMCWRVCGWLDKTWECALVWRKRCSVWCSPNCVMYNNTLTLWLSLIMLRFSQMSVGSTSVFFYAVSSSFLSLNLLSLYWNNSYLVIFQIVYFKIPWNVGWLILKKIYKGSLTSIL